MTRYDLDLSFIRMRAADYYQFKTVGINETRQKMISMLQNRFIIEYRLVITHLLFVAMGYIFLFFLLE